jgi:hypothetical protein
MASSLLPSLLIVAVQLPLDHALIPLNDGILTNKLANVLHSITPVAVEMATILPAKMRGKFPIPFQQPSPLAPCPFFLFSSEKCLSQSKCEDGQLPLKDSGGHLVDCNIANW